MNEEILIEKVLEVCINVLLPYGRRFSVAEDVELQGERTGLLETSKPLLSRLQDTFCWYSVSESYACLNILMKTEKMETPPPPHPPNLAFPICSPSK